MKYKKANPIGTDLNLAKDIHNSFITGGADLTELSPKNSNKTLKPLNFNEIDKQFKKIFEINDYKTKNLQDQYTSSKRFFLNPSAYQSSANVSSKQLNDPNSPKSLVQMDQEMRRRNYYKN